jgi:protein-tyrosine phosphatase
VRQRVKRILPPLLGTAARDCAGLPLRVVLTYVRLRTARILGARRDEARLSERPASLLFVCHGNIMRSPFAAELTRARLGQASRHFAIASAGTGAAGARPADPRAIVAADRYGISLRAHRSLPLTPELVDASSVICVMDYRNEAEVVARFPRASRKTMLLGGAVRTTDPPDIPDPYRLEDDDVARVYERLALAVDALVGRLTST